jgi:excisionase family DNA binding protein
MNKKMISTREAADLLQTSQRWIVYLIASGELTSTRASKAGCSPWLVTRAQVIVLAKKRVARLKKALKKQVGTTYGRTESHKKTGRAHRSNGPARK